MTDMSPQELDGMKQMRKLEKPCRTTDGQSKKREKKDTIARVSLVTVSRVTTK